MNDAARARFLAGNERLLMQQDGALADLQAAVDHDPGLAIAWALKGFAERNASDFAAAQASIDRAKAIAEKTPQSVWEDSVIAIVDALMRGQFGEVLDRSRNHLTLWPTDAIVVSYVVFLLNVAIGAPDRDQQMLEIVESTVPAYDDDPIIYGYLSFALEENRQFEQAHDAASHALEALPQFARAAHTLAHTYLERGLAAEGDGFLASWLEGWVDPGPTGCHFEWHRALFHLDNGDIAAARSPLDPIVGYLGRSTGVLTDGASLAWRLHLDGETDLPWASFYDLPDQPGFAFSNAHHALALAGAGDADGLARYAGRLNAMGVTETNLAIVALWAQALADFVRGDAAAAAKRLDCLSPYIRLLGGSHAQSQVVHDTHIAALQRCDRKPEAASILQARLRQRPCARDEAWLARL